jgi:hypothetical protein
MSKISEQIKYVSGGGIGLSGWFFLLLAGLKLTGFISLSWWWVTCPLWGGVALVLLIALILSGLAAIAKIASLLGK